MWVRNQSAGGRGRSYSTAVYRHGTLTILTQSVNMKEGEMKSENVSLRPVGAAAAPFPEMLCIFGTGDLGRSLGLRLLQSGYRVVYGSRRPDSCGPVPPGAQVRHRVRSLPEMLQKGKKECFAHVRVFLFLHSLCFSFFFYQVTSHAEAAKLASLIFVCVHREHYEFLQTLAPYLKGKVNILSVTSGLLK